MGKITVPESEKLGGVPTPVIEIPLKGAYPISVKVIDGSRIVGTYSIIKTKKNGFRLEK